MDRISSTTLETTVASAAPVTPILGRPKRPKIKTAFRKILRITAIVLMVATFFVFFPSFIWAKKHWERPVIR